MGVVGLPPLGGQEVSEGRILIDNYYPTTLLTSYKPIKTIQ